MASNDNDEGLLTGSDKVTDELLSHVSNYVIPRHLKQFATGPLKLSNNDFDIIEVNHNRNVKRINIEVKSYLSIVLHRANNSYWSLLKCERRALEG